MVMQPARQHMSEVRQLYRRLSIPASVEQVEEENELKNDQ